MLPWAAFRFSLLGGVQKCTADFRDFLEDLELAKPKETHEMAVDLERFTEQTTVEHPPEETGGLQETRWLLIAVCSGHHST